MTLGYLDALTISIKIHVDDLMEINVEDPELENFSPDYAVLLWWSDCNQRPDQAPRKQYRKRALSEVESEIQ